MVSGILRLADKYVLDSLRKTAIAHLRVAWPLSLADWDAREDLARIYELETGMHRGFRFPSPVVSNFIVTVVMFLTFNTVSGCDTPSKRGLRA